VAKAKTGLLTYADVEDMLSCSNDKVRAMVKAGILKEPQWYEGLGVRFWEDDVLAYVYGERLQKKKPPKRKPKGDSPPVNPRSP
jgi:hypothetical protein